MIKSVDLTQNLRKKQGVQQVGHRQSARQYAGLTDLQRPTTLTVARALSSSMYFGTENASIRAYAPQVIEKNKEFWVGQRSI